MRCRAKKPAKVTQGVQSELLRQLTPQGPATGSQQVCPEPPWQKEHVCGGKHQLRRRPPLPCTLCAPRNTGSTQEGDPLSTSTTPTHWVGAGWARVLPVTPLGPPPLRPTAQNLSSATSRRGVCSGLSTLSQFTHFRSRGMDLAGA